MTSYDIPTMYDKANFAAGVMKVVFCLNEWEDYTKEDAVRDLVELLKIMDCAVIVYKHKEEK